VFGFTLADYFGEWGTWSRLIVPGLRGTLGVTALVLAAGGVVAAVAALRARPRNGRVLATLIAAVLIAIAYVFTPYSAQGFAGAPDSAPNARYVVPALVLLAPASAWAATRFARLGVALQIAALAGLVYGIAGTDAYRVPLSGRSIATAALVVAVAATAAAAVWRFRPRVRHAARAVAVAAGVAAALAIGYSVERKFDDRRYAGIEPALDWILDNAPAHHRVGLAGLGYNPVVYPAYGPALENEVHYVGPVVDGMLRPYTRRRALLRAVRDGRYDVLVVQRQGWVRRRLPARQEAWLRAAGWRALAESPGAALYAPRLR
jgi:hypothetical protein